jgi:hypothetical protein
MVRHLPGLVIQPELIHSNSELAGKCSGVSSPRTVDSLFPGPEGPVADSHPPCDCCGRERCWYHLGALFADCSNPIHSPASLLPLEVPKLQPQADSMAH